MKFNHKSQQGFISLLEFSTFASLLEVVKQLVIITDRCRCISHQIFSIAGFWESYDVTNAVGLN